MLEAILVDFADIIVDHEILQGRGGNALSVRLFLKDGSQLAVYEALTKHGHKYNYNWMRGDNTLIIAWDCDPNHPEIETHPYHKHIDNRKNIEPSEPMDLRKVLAFIAKIISVLALIVWLLNA